MTTGATGSATAARIAIVHYTAPPAIGGIEQLIAAQCSTLTEFGRSVRLITSGGDTAPGTSHSTIPELDPDHPAVRYGRSHLGSALPADDHPLVRRLTDGLRLALDGCDQCWVHNALTMYSNPFLTAALLHLVRETPNFPWVAWCEDSTATSRYYPPLSSLDRERVQLASKHMRVVTISAARRDELSTLLALPAGRITVIHPPLAAVEWLGLSGEANRLVERLNLMRAEPLILLPAKLLPHKNVQFALRVLAHLPGRPAGERTLLFSGVSSPHDRQTSAREEREVQSLAHRLGIEEHIHDLSKELGHAADWRTIRDLMLLADLVFVPSTEEGFGMPLLEAAVLRAPLLCAGIPALRETGGDAAHFFALDADPAVVAHQIETITDEPRNRQRRNALRSSAAFRVALRNLLHEVAGDPAPFAGTVGGTNPAAGRGGRDGHEGDAEPR